jgi:hypothetical protein
MPLTVVLHSQLSLSECEQRFDRLGRGGLYAWKQITGRAATDRITLLIGPEELAIKRIGAASFQLGPSWLGQGSRWFEGSRHRRSLSGRPRWHYRIDVQSEGEGARLSCRRSLTTGFLAIGLSTRSTQSDYERRAMDDDLELYLKETIDADVVGYQAPSDS